MATKDDRRLTVLLPIARDQLDSLPASETAQRLRDALPAEVPSAAGTLLMPDRLLAELFSGTPRRGIPSPIDTVAAVLMGATGLALATGETPRVDALRETVRTVNTLLGARFPGQTIEIRVPPASAVQVGAFGQGPSHHRGTPPNVAETDPATWAAIGLGLLSYADAKVSGRLTASGSHVDEVARMVPLANLSTHLA